MNCDHRGGERQERDCARRGRRLRDRMRRAATCCQGLARDLRRWSPRMSTASGRGSCRMTACSRCGFESVGRSEVGVNELDSGAKSHCPSADRAATLVDEPAPQAIQPDIRRQPTAVARHRRSAPPSWLPTGSAAAPCRCAGSPQPRRRLTVTGVTRHSGECENCWEQVEFLRRA